jgi:hypothetical protein
MDKRGLCILLIPVFLSCKLIINDWKQLDLGAFKISIPKDWVYQKLDGVDSFIGVIKTPKSTLQFDCSSMGYANHLVLSENEYLKGDDWLMNYTPFYKVGVTYTANFNVKAEKLRQMKERGITDSTLIHIEADPSYETKRLIHKPTIEQKKKYPNADYIADLTYRDSTIHIPITIPIEIKHENIRIDTTEKYIIKTIWPKIAAKGITGVNIKNRKSDLNFNLVGAGLSKQEQEMALQMFKTIQFKK